MNHQACREYAAQSISEAMIRKMVETGMNNDSLAEASGQYVTWIEALIQEECPAIDSISDIFHAMGYRIRIEVEPLKGKT